MERSIEQAVRSVERVLRIAARDPLFVKRLTAAVDAKDNRTVELLTRRLEHLGSRSAEALTVDVSVTEPKVSIYQSGINRHGHRIGIQLILMQESRN